MLRTASSWIVRSSLRGAVPLVALVLVSAPSDEVFAQGKNRKAEEKPTKNWSVPWFLTLVCFGGLVAPVCVAAKRQWDLPFHLEELEEEKKREREKQRKK